MINKPRAPSLKEIVPLEVIAGQVALYHKVDEADIFKRTRKRKFTEMRYEFFALCRHFNKFSVSLKAMGEYCADRFDIKAYDHSLVLYGIKTNTDHRETENKRLVAFYKIADNIKIEAGSSECREFLKLKSHTIKMVMRTKSRKALNNALNEL